jgi:hypothetical protein
MERANAGARPGAVSKTAAAPERAERRQDSQLVRPLHAGAHDGDGICLGAREHVRRQRAREPGAYRGQMRRVHDGQQRAGRARVQAEHAADGGLLGRELGVHLDGVGGNPGGGAGKEDGRRARTGEIGAHATRSLPAVGGMVDERRPEQRQARRRVEQRLDLRATQQQGGCGRRHQSPGTSR